MTDRMKFWLKVGGLAALFILALLMLVWERPFSLSEFVQGLLGVLSLGCVFGAGGGDMGESKERKVSIKWVILAVVAIVLLLALARSCDAASLSVTWDPNTENDLAGYQVYWGTKSGVYGAPVAVGSEATSYLLTGLLDNTRYYVALKAFDTSGNFSAFSLEASAVTGDQTPPGPPQGVKAAPAPKAPLAAPVFGPFSPLSKLLEPPALRIEAAWHIARW